MKTLPPFPLLLALAALSLPAFGQSTVIYNHTFDGPNATALNGTAADGSAQTWVANADIKADGTSGTKSASAWLPYAFGTGVYTLTADIDVSGAGTTNFSLISFTNTSDLSAITGDLSGHRTSYATFGQRGAGDWDFWGGEGATNGIDGSAAGTFPKVNTIKLVLDTTQANWVVTASLLNASSEEVFADLNGSSPGVGYTFATNPAPFTGIGFFLRSGNAIDRINLSVAAIPEPTTFGLFGGIAVLGLGAFRRRRC